jgi:hypothetical protein
MRLLGKKKIFRKKSKKYCDKSTPKKNFLIEESDVMTARPSHSIIGGSTEKQNILFYDTRNIHIFSLPKFMFWYI